MAHRPWATPAEPAPPRAWPESHDRHRAAPHGTSGSSHRSSPGLCPVGGTVPLSSRSDPEEGWHLPCHDGRSSMTSAGWYSWTPVGCSSRGDVLFSAVNQARVCDRGCFFCQAGRARMLASSSSCYRLDSSGVNEKSAAVLRRTAGELSCRESIHARLAPRCAATARQQMAAVRGSISLASCVRGDGRQSAIDCSAR
jgi:hypothetical protein